MSTQTRDYQKLLRDALQTIRELRQKLETAASARIEPIAVVGIGCRFPGGVRSPADYWALLAGGVDAIAEIPPDRWDVDYYYDPAPGTPGKIATREGGFLEDKDTLDPQFFRISPREAMFLDPQQRVLLEVAWNAIEDAGIPRDSLYGSDAGVFVGITSMDYSNLMAEYLPEPDVDSTVGTGGAHSPAAGRISYFLGLHGPSMSIDTACSSSLVAVDAACASLRRRECSLALAGGVNMILSPFNHVALSAAHMLAPDGRCKAFDQAANGYGRSEGVGIVVLKRLSDALRDQDSILALIRGSAVNQDGASSGLTVPNRFAQDAVIRRALENGGVEPAAVDYVEAHGTGTALGDPIELNALGDVFAATHDRARPLLVGSSKTNLGHMEAAAGIGGLIKVVLQLHHEAIAPHLHLHQPSTHIPWHELPIEVVTSLRPWPRRDKQRVAGVSSFGFSGTNAHVVLEEAPPMPESPRSFERPRHILTLSAKTSDALDSLVAAYADLVDRHPDIEIGELCYSANTGRTHFAHRLAIQAGTTTELGEILGAVQQGAGSAAATRGQSRSPHAPRVAFLFTGQGSQYAGMGRELYQTQPVFREALERCASILSGHVDWSLLDLLYADDDRVDVNQTGYAQPLIFAVEYALATLWQSWGVTPAVMMGHSVGEYVAACLAGVFRLEDALALIAARGKLMQALPEDGGMMAVQSTEEEVRALIEPYADEVSIAAINGQTQIVISGARSRLQALDERLTAQGVRTRALAVSHAFHSPLMQPMLADFARVTERVQYAAPRIDLISNLTGTRVLDDVSRADYWVQHVSLPVRFYDGILAAHALGCEIFLEVGPRPMLAPMGRRCIDDPGLAWMSSIEPRRGNWEQMLDSLGALYVRGVTIDWQAFDRDYGRRKVRLPTYPFRRERYWFGHPGMQAKIAPRRSAIVHPLLGQRLPNRDGSIERIVFESRLSPDSPAYLVDHRVFGSVIVPAAGYLELAMAAGSAVLPGATMTVRNFVVRAPLHLSAGTVTRVRTVLSPDKRGDYQLQVLATTDEDDMATWEVHAQGVVGVGAGPAAAHQDLGALARSMPESVEPAAYYQGILRRGLEYGPAFQGIRALRRDGGRVLGRVAIPEHIAGDQDAHLLHPVLLDSAFQMLGALMGTGDDDATSYLPTSIESLHCGRKLGTEKWALVSLRARGPASDRVQVADVVLMDDDGSSAAVIAGLQLVRTTPAALRRALHGDPARFLFHYTWPRKDLPEPTAASEQRPDRWLVFADRGGLGNAVARALEARGHTVTLLYADSGARPGESPVATSHAVDPGRPEHMADVLGHIAATNGSAQLGIIYLWGQNLLEPADATPADLERSELLGCAPLLHLVKWLSKHGAPSVAPFFVVTRGAFHLDSHPGVVHPEQAGLVGFSRALRLEMPSLRCTHLDLDPRAGRTSAEVEVRHIVRDALASDGEEQVALRAGLRFAARIDRLEGALRPPGVPAGPVRVAIDSYGAIEKLAIEPHQRRAPGKGEVEIAVRAAGINFKDILLVLGLLEKHAREHGIEWAHRRTMGFECAGVITRVGECVDGPSVGDAVIAHGSECLSSHVTLDAGAVVRKPDNVRFEEAAAVGTAFLTAYHALHVLAKIQPGDKVLIHAGAGGVGQAAIQLCRRIGAEVYATASPPKWDFLRSLGITHVASSRTLEFREQVLAWTGGQGVDVVLNSLNGDFIPANIDVLAQGGRFVEIGKLGIWTPAQVAAVRPDLAYYTFDLSETSEDVTLGFHAVLSKVMSWMAEGTVAALPVEAFGLDQVADAFRYLAQAKNIGKVVVAFPAEEEAEQAEQAPVRADGTYLITGGLGGLGLAVAEWLVEEGARHLLLAGRREPSAATREAIRSMEDRGARVQVACADVAVAEDVAALLERIASAGMPPLAGVFHAAGVLDDGILQEQTPERFARVMAPKVTGTWNLHVHTRELPLDCFVCFSSLTAMLGTAGQSNYAAANAFMTALMYQRRAQGLPGLGIDWGPWAEVGMAARLDVSLRKQRATRGLRALRPRVATAVLGHLLRRATVYAGVVDVDWPRFARMMGMGTRPLYLERLAGEEPELAARGAGQTSGEISRERLDSAPAEERHALLLSLVRALVARVLGYASSDRIEPSHRFLDLGIDSLSSVELKNQLEALLDCSLPASLLFDFPSVETAVGYLHDHVLGYAADGGVATAHAGEPST